jgi:hypothetical protein
LPKVSFAGWVGTIKHNTMDDDENREEQRDWYCGGWTRAIVRETKNMAHTKQKKRRHVSFRFSLEPSDNVNKNT